MSSKYIIVLLCIVVVDSLVLDNNPSNDVIESDFDEQEKNENNIFDGVYSECFLYLSYSCLQRKTLLYLKELNKLSEVSVIGEYVKFVKTNATENDNLEDSIYEEAAKSKNSDDLSYVIDRAVDMFFNNHILMFSALGKDIAVPNTVEDFVGRKRKGGGGGGGGGGGHGHGGGDDGGKKKMMMMAMMCMKMKFMMMVPAMMGMMGMMSFKGMMFSMMSFMISKMMLLMKILEKRGGGGGGGGGGGDGGWAAGGGGGGGAWMPAGGDYGGGGGGGYDANGQWQSRSILERNPETFQYSTEGFQERIANKPIVSYVTPIVRHNNNVIMKKPFSIVKKLNDEVVKVNQDVKEQSRIKREAGNENPYVRNVTTDNDNSSEENEKIDDLRNHPYNNNGHNKFDTDLKGTPHPPFENLKANKIINKAYHPRMERQVPIYESSISMDDGADSYEIDTAYNAPLEFDDDFIDKSYPKIEKHIDGIAKNTVQNSKFRYKRGIVDILQNAYMYWINNLLGMNNYKKYQPKYPKYKVINGIKYVYQPLMHMNKAKAPKELQNNIATVIKEEEGFKPIVTEDNEPSPIITADNFNKGEIVEGAVESRMTKKLQEFKDTVSEVIEDNPWQ